MRVLVTGGSGVVGDAAVSALLERGHVVRLFSRRAVRDAAAWERDVEPHEGSITDPARVQGAAAGCEAVLHLAAIVAESPPAETFDRVNVEGTRLLLEEARRAGAPRFIYVSSLGADRGHSAYHRSKRRAEALVYGYPGDWLICRPGNVYGPGDELISLLLRMVRGLPVVPVIGRGDQPIQPVWAGDVGRALAAAVERRELTSTALALAGPDITCMRDLLDRFHTLTGRRPLRFPLPLWLAIAGVRAAAAVGVDVGLTRDELVMLEEGSVVRPGDRNGLAELLGESPVSLASGLGALSDALPEQLPREGHGRLWRRRYWADIEGAPFDAEALMRVVREEFGELAPTPTMSTRAEPGTPERLTEGATITMALPLRGHVQVRVEELTARTTTLVTVEGHPLAGAVRLSSSGQDAGVRFEVETFDRAATLPDLAAVSTFGRALKHLTWEAFVRRVVERSGGTALASVQTTSEALEGEEAERVEAWLERLVMARRRAEHAAPDQSTPEGSERPAAL